MATIDAASAGSANLVHFLDLIAWSEGTCTSPATKNDGYDVIVTGADGKSNVLTDYTDHPFADGRPPVIVRLVPRWPSTAAGRYQVIVRWWRAYKTILGLQDFSPLSQDRVALKQIEDGRGKDLIVAGKIPEAITQLSNLWASFPGSMAGQGGKSMAALLATWEQISSAGP